jgi:hypothetical protein
MLKRPFENSKDIMIIVIFNNYYGVHALQRRSYRIVRFRPRPKTRTSKQSDQTTGLSFFPLRKHHDVPTKNRQWRELARSIPFVQAFLSSMMASKQAIILQKPKK